MTEAGPGKPEVLQIKTSIEDADRVMETVNDAIMAPLKGAPSTLPMAKGWCSRCRRAVERPPRRLVVVVAVRIKRALLHVTDWSDSTNASMTMQITVAYDKNELENKKMPEF